MPKDRASMQQAAVNTEGIARLQAHLDRTFVDGRPIRVLEAGCGAVTRVHFGQNSYVVGTDTSEVQLAKNPVLDERILADVQTQEFSPGSFDAVVCWNVLEHLSDPGRALRNFVTALGPGGVIVLALPNVWSVKALLTKLTPYRFHAWALRRFFGSPNAGKPGYDPFPTFLRLSIAPKALDTFARDNGLLIDYVSIFEHPRHRMLRERFGLRGRSWEVIRTVVRTATFGRVSADQTDCILVLKKLEATQALS